MRGVMRSDRQIVEPERYFTVAILSGAVSVISLIAMLLSANFASERNLGAGQVLKLIGYSAAVERGEVAMIHCMAITGLVVGIAGCVTALAMYIRTG
jgi:hypothetical protein